MPDDLCWRNMSLRKRMRKCIFEKLCSKLTCQGSRWSNFLSSTTEELGACVLRGFFVTNSLARQFLQACDYTKRCTISASNSPVHSHTTTAESTMQGDSLPFKSSEDEVTCSGTPQHSDRRSWDPARKWHALEIMVTMSNLLRETFFKLSFEKSLRALRSFKMALSSVSWNAVLMLKGGQNSEWKYYIFNNSHVVVGEVLVILADARMQGDLVDSDAY